MRLQLGRVQAVSRAEVLLTGLGRCTEQMCMG